MNIADTNKCTFCNDFDETIAHVMFQYTHSLGSLSNDDGNANENVEKQWIKLQNTIIARGNATTCPLFRRRL